MAILYVISGHGAGDSGAVGNGRAEADVVREISSRLKDLGGSSVVELDKSVNWYASKRVNLDLKKTVGSNPVIELHMDSATASARGGHVIIDSTLAPDAYDNALANFVKGFFPGRSNVIVKRSDLANPKRAKANSINYRLLECCFITNSEDMRKLSSDMDGFCRGILGAFGIGASVTPTQPNETKPQNPTPSPNTSGEKTGTGFGGKYRCYANGLRIRTSPAIRNDNIVPNVSYNKGDTVTLDDWYKIADGYVWGRYTGAQSGQKRYVAVGKPTGGVAPGDFLKKL